MKIDAQTKAWIRKELALLEQDEEYSPMIPGLDDLIETWREYNPKMYAELAKENLARPLAQVIQAKIWDDQEEIYCRKCGVKIELDQIVTNDDCGKRGWNFDRVVCPQGHNLLVVESVHLMVG